MAEETTGAAGPGRGGRMSRRRKTAAVLRLLRGEDLETVSRALGVTAATLTAWRDAFLDRGLAEAGVALCDRGEAFHLPDATHWVQHEEPERVNRLLVEFLA